MSTATLARPGRRTTTGSSPSLKVALMSVGELYGGVEQFIYTFSMHLRETRLARPLVILFHHGVLEDKLRAAGIDVEIVRAPFKYDPRAIRNVERILRSRRIQVLHTHGYKATVLGGLAARRTGARVVKTEHGAVEPHRGLAAIKMALNDRLDRWATRKFVDEVVYITHDLMNSRKVRGRWGTALVIHNGIPSPRFQGGDALRLPARALNIGIIGRVCPVKGHAKMLSALSMVRDLPVHLHVIGSGPSMRAVKSETKRLALEDRVSFHGFRSSVHDDIARLDVVAMPSLNEGLPYTLLEAMHLGRPIVASAVGGMKEILIDGETALLTPPQDVPALADALRRLAADPELRGRLGNAARRAAMESFEIREMARRYLNVYGTLLAQRPSRRAAVWITWENHRRTRELSRAMGVAMEVVRRPKNPLLHTLVPALRTALRLLSGREKIVIVQNPSLVLTVIACALKPLRGYRLVQDLHSYFAWHLENPKTFRQRVYRALSLFCMRRADLSIVTNEPLRRVIDENGGRGFVLQDKLPDISSTEVRRPSESFNVAFICTYSADEPLAEVADAARRLGPDYRIYVTGRPPKGKTFEGLPANLVQTGFLSDADYATLLCSVDAVMALTTREHTLLCGAYEAISAGRPLVLSDTRALRAYFRRGAVYTETRAAGLAEAIRQARLRKTELDAEIRRLASDLTSDWQRRFVRLMDLLKSYESRRSS